MPITIDIAQTLPFLKREQDPTSDPANTLVSVVGAFC